MTVRGFLAPGVNPGEEVEILVVGAGPEGPDEGRLALSFSNRHMHYPNGGVVWTEPGPESAPSSRPSSR